MVALGGRVAVITGAGRGIGASIARELARRGAGVVVNDLGVSLDGQATDARDAAVSVAEEIMSAGGNAVADVSDIAEAEGGNRVVQTALDVFGRLDVLVNAAGILRDRMIFNMTDDEWDAVIRVHLRGHFSTIRPAAAHWRQWPDADGQRRIVNVTSRSGLYGAASQPNYAAAKMGIVGLTFSCAKALAAYGVTCNAIAPTAATRMATSVPLDKRILDVDDATYSPDSIAPLVAYLASERSGWLNGRVLGVVGNRITLYRNPEPERQVVSAQPWGVDELAAAVEQAFGAQDP